MPDHPRSGRSFASERAILEKALERAFSEVSVSSPLDELLHTQDPAMHKDISSQPAGLFRPEKCFEALKHLKEMRERRSITALEYEVAKLTLVMRSCRRSRKPPGE